MYRALLTAWMFVLFCGCSRQKEATEAPSTETAAQVSASDHVLATPSVLDAFQGKNIASLSGTVFDLHIDRRIQQVKHQYYNDLPSMIAALDTGKVDAIGVDEPVGKLLEAQFPRLYLVPEPVCVDQYGFAITKGNPLGDKASAVIRQLRADGTLKAMEQRWFSASAEQGEKIPTLDYRHDFDGKGGVLRFNHDSVNVPMSYVGAGGSSQGFDVELAARIAYELNMVFQPTAMSFSGLLESLLALKADMVGGSMSITPERLKTVDFTEGYYNGGIYLLARADAAKTGRTAPAKVTSWRGRFKSSFISTFVVENRYQLVVRGFGVTMLISVLAILLGTVLGFGVCALRRSHHVAASVPAKIYIRSVQGTPILVLLMILYYVIFGRIDVNAIAIAVFAFAINFAAYAAEMFRSGMDAIDRGQIEAAEALGFRRLQVFFRIMLPQAARHVLPVFKGEVIATVKMTSVVGYIAIQDLTKVSDIIRSRTYEAFFPLLSTAVIYFVFTYVLTSLLTLVEMRIDPRQRPRVLKGVEVKK